jgi:serine/threonine protein kinase
LASALAAAHRAGVIHRDVSPTNVQVDAHGQVHLIDFGIARVAGLAQTTAGGSARGKWAYAAPEQLAGLPLDGRTDLFALGSLLVECLVGVAPFADSGREATLARIQRAEPLHWPALATPWQDAEPLLRSLVAKNPEDRPADAATVGQRLDFLVNHAVAEPQRPDGGSVARPLLAARVATVQTRVDPIGAEPAELRGEDITRPELDPDATQVRIETT